MAATIRVMVPFDERTALIVVDVQNDFTDPAGSLAVRGAGQIVPRINEEIRAANDAGDEVVFTQDWHPESTPHFAKDGGVWPVHCVRGTWGAELYPALEADPNAPRVRKGSNGEDGYSGFMMRDPIIGADVPTQLDALLKARNVERVVICGLATDYCVRGTVLDALRLGYSTALIGDAIAAVELKDGDAERAIQEMRDAGADLV
jgi:nicotinamidase/pyrazinamidase